MILEESYKGRVSGIIGAFWKVKQVKNDKQINQQQIAVEFADILFAAAAAVSLPSDSNIFVPESEVRSKGKKEER